MENNEPLLKDEKESLSFGNEETKEEVEEREVAEEIEEKEEMPTSNYDDTTFNEEKETVEKEDIEEEKQEEIPNEEMQEENEEEEVSSKSQEGEESSEIDYKVEEKYKKEVIKPLPSSEKEPKETNDKKKNTVSLVVTLILTALVAYLLVRTCIGFYYGFKYKDYVPEATTTEQP